MTPNIDDIRRDDELLDSLGQRQPLHQPDRAADVLASWARQIDAPAPLPRPGRYARTKRTRTRAGVIAAITVATLSVSGVAAAVGGMPGFSGVAAQLGFVHRSADFGAGAAGTTSTSAPSSTRSGVTPRNDVSTDVATSETGAWTPGAALPPRTLPGVVRPAPGRGDRTGHPAPSTTSTDPSQPSSTSSPHPPKPPSPDPTSPSSTHTKKPKPTHPPKPPGSPSSPVWSPVSTPTSTPSSTESSTTEPSPSETSSSASSSASHGSSPAR